MEKNKKNIFSNLKDFFKKIERSLINDYEVSFGKKEAQMIFSKEETLTNLRVIWNLRIVILLGPILLIGYWLKIFPHIDPTSILVLSGLTIGIWVLLFLITKYVKDLAKNPLLKYFYVFIFNCIVWSLAFCPGLDVRLGYLLVPLVACVYFNSKFLIITDILSYFTLVFSMVTRFFLKNIPNYIHDEVPVEITENFVNQFLNGKQWLCDSLVRMSLEFGLFVLIQMILFKKVYRIFYLNKIQNDNINNLQRGLIRGMATLVEFREPSTGNHLSRVSAFVREISKELVEEGYYKEYLTDEMIHILENASAIHDIGKISVPDSILTKESILTAEEFAIIKQHPLAGAQIIERYISPYYEDKLYMNVVKEIILYHHECWNGNGYPYGLKENDIPLSARIMAVADVLDSLLSTRPYKKSYTIDKAYKIIIDSSGVQFDPTIVSVLPKIQDKLNEIAQSEVKNFIKTKPEEKI